MLGNDQSPGGGHSAATCAGTALSARQGRCSSNAVFSTSLSPYATTVPAPASTTPATASPERPRARHQHTTHTAPSTSSPTSVASAGTAAGRSANAATTRR
ncbi:hypothetical protein ACFV1L_24715 [Kitasatospora sp. NPDC059646]|uniref:hypothetical protein n=1 Tax=Kitasatospora sp. NPDC059646 TaxID=3346893 RepID=UPI00368A1404